MNDRPRPTVEAPPAWSEVSAEAPCPRCGACDGCSVCAEAGFVRCFTHVSARPIAAGGWLHTLEVRTEELVTA